MHARDMFGPADPDALPSVPSVPSFPAALATPFAWPQSGLEPMPWFPFTVAASRGHAAAAARVAQRIERAYWYLRRLFGVTPRFRLLVLGPDDWARYAEVPTFGVVHLTASGHLIVGSEPAAAWHGVSRELAALLPTATRRALVRVHGQDPTYPAGPDLAGVADALLAHDVAHLFAVQANLVFPRRWLAEAFANYALVAVLGETDTAALHLVGTLADPTASLADATPTLLEYERAEGALDVMPSVLVQLALTRGVFGAYAMAQAKPLARWFAQSRAASPGPDGPVDDAELAQRLARDVHPAIGALVADRRPPVAKAA
jgi:hypothetical protein